MVSLDFLIDWIALVVWPFIRISAMFLAAPIFGAKSVPVRIRIVLAMMIAIMIAPMLDPMPDIEPISIAGMVVTVQQVLIGVAMGFLLQLVFATTVFMGQSIAMSMGLGFASVIDPQNGVSVPVVSQFFLILTTLLFLSMDGHLVMVAALVGSFEAYPVSAALPDGMLFYALAQWAGYVFLLALMMALPAILTVLLINLSFGVMTRAAPQLNIFAVGFPVTILAGFIVMLFSLSMFEMQVTSLFELGLDSLVSLFAGGSL